MSNVQQGLVSFRSAVDGYLGQAVASTSGVPFVLWTAGAQDIDGAPMIFASALVSDSSVCASFVTGDTAITLAADGVYRVTLSVSFAAATDLLLVIRLNDVESGSVSDSGALVNPVSASVLCNAVAGDLVTIQNYTTNADILGATVLVERLY